MDKLQRATDYLAHNTALRGALDIPTDAHLLPQFLGHGEHNDNFVFTDPATNARYVLRINVVSQPFHTNQVAYEFAALCALQQSECTPTPRYLDDSKELIDTGVLVTDFCEGDELDLDDLRDGDLGRTAQIMADVHAVTVDDKCPLFRPQNPLRTLFEECLQRFEVYHNSAYEDARITAWAKRFIAAAEPATQTDPPADICTHIINTETLPSHFLLPRQNTGHEAEKETADTADTADPSAGSPAGFFVDWERPLIGEVAQDVAYFTSPTTSFWDSNYLFTPTERHDFVENYWACVGGRFTDNSFEERFKAWLMMTALRSTAWCCKALIPYHEDPEQLTDKARGKLPIYLSDEFMEMLATDCFDL